MTAEPTREGRIALDEAVELSRTGDLWLFRGGSLADHAIRTFTNAPVNHVGMAVVLEDLPPLMWHAELGKGLLDVWTGKHQRGVQLHDLSAAVTQWMDRYEQRAWLRQLSVKVTPGHGGQTADDDRADGRAAVPVHGGAHGPGGARPDAPSGAGGAGLLRRGRRGELHRDGAARRLTAGEL